MKTVEKMVNVAPTSDEGHFVKGAKKVVNLDMVTEAFFIEGESELVTKNHTTLQQKEDCLIVCQQVYNPFSKMMERSKD